MLQKKYKSLSKNSEKEPLFGFTLVELVVVIAILAILGTIAFISVGGYSSRTRDSARAADVAQVIKSLDLSIITSGSYPSPDNSFSVTYSGGVVWNQWVIGTNVVQRFHTAILGGGLSKKPVDPLKGAEYVYSSLAYGKAYQIKTEYEGDTLAANPLLDTANAAVWNPKIAYIKGNYGGLTAKTQTGDIVYVLAVPSIITNTGTLAGGLLSLSSLSGSLLYHGKPLQGASPFNPGAVVFSGSELPANDKSGQITAIMTNLKNAYSGSDVGNNNSSVSSLLGTTSPEALVSLGSAVITGQLGGTSTTGNNNDVIAVACSPGTYSATGKSPCSAATAGNYVSSTGATVQTVCPANSYCLAGSKVPTACTAGTASPAGSSVSTACVITQTNPSALALAHSGNSKTFTFSWTAGSLNGGSCKIQYSKNGTWTAISATTYNCDSNISNTAVTLPGDGWYSGNWNGTQVRIIRTSDSVVLGTFGQTLSCSANGGSSYSTPTIDEDCNGYWDNTTTSPPNVQDGCNGGNVCYYYTAAVYKCDGSADTWDWLTCTSPGYSGGYSNYGQCSGGLPAGGWDYFQSNYTPSSGCSTDYGSQTVYM